MDYRNRKYYIVQFDYESFDMRKSYFKIASPSIKFHSPYNHIKGNNTYKNYDTVDLCIRPWYMISCREDESRLLQLEMEKASRNDSCFNYRELTREFCKQ